ncbi:NAD(P)/FAD-dependent oxidoreductase [Flammeovirga sp. EKP202]|uniref:NAD(P)/FAD-dependent oxidoreductase n=1 Tax=Flammeovirga sp. EKP202 TaxID=2770592 RepID=UPI00165FDB64|nr:FAD-dependent monooxygenase [Flammeovirga sp. EKP202]MBD0400864.1 FAD-dependent monooxygenase [Flammeovirga sp. EKP202]
MYDVCIIGGGLGGLSLSIQMADLGWNVLLLEKKEYPFHRVCGEYVAAESWDFLRRIGIDDNALQLPKITDLLVSAPNGEYLESDLTSGGIGISRHLLDDSLYKIALQKGVTVLTKTTAQSILEIYQYWEITTQKETYIARSVVGAFGKRSNLDHRLNRSYIDNSKSRLNHFVAVKYHLKGDFDAHKIELHNFEGGYCGLSKVENDILCMCYMVSGKVFYREGNIENLEKNVLQKNPFLKKYLQYTRLWKKPLSIAQIDFSKKDIIEKNIPMIGDASGLIAPLCGNGMSMSIHASVIIAPLLHQYLNDELIWSEMNDEYARQWKHHFKTRLKAGRLLQQSFGKNFITNIILQLLKGSNKTTQKIIEATHGATF